MRLASRKGYIPFPTSYQEASHAMRQTTKSAKPEKLLDKNTRRRLKWNGVEALSGVGTRFCMRTRIFCVGARLARGRSSAAVGFGGSRSEERRVGKECR